MREFSPNNSPGTIFFGNKKAKFIVYVKFQGAINSFQCGVLTVGLGDITPNDWVQTKSTSKSGSATFFGIKSFRVACRT